MLQYEKRLKASARAMRKNSTDGEKKLWNALRNKGANGFQFYRQKPIGKYIADFYCPKLKLVVEVDGGEHYTAQRMAYDNKRTEFLEGRGLKVLRFSNIEVKRNLRGVLITILGSATF